LLLANRNTVRVTAYALLIEALEKQNKAAQAKTRQEELRSIMANMGNMAKMKQHK
jgi:hypothetical protein